MNNETWILEAAIVPVEKMVSSGSASLSPWEVLVYCLWVADYGMRNAGDLAAATDLHADFQAEARRAAEYLALPLTFDAFSLNQSQLEQQYFDRFESICNEIRRAEPGDTPKV